jgi:hypothetical protein
MIRDAMTLASGEHPDLNALNTRMIVIGGKPVDLTKVEGNVVFDPMQTPDGQAMTPTAIGQAMVGADAARAADSYASAGAHNAAAARSRAGIGADKAANYELLPDQSGQLVRVNKLTGQAAPIMVDGSDAEGPPIARALMSGGKGHGSGSSPALTSEEIKAMFGGPMGVDAAKYTKFLQYMKNNGITDARQAALNYSTDMHGVQSGSSTGVPVAPPAPSRLDSIKQALGLGGSAPVPPGVPAVIDPAKQATAQDAARPVTQADYNNLASGTLYLDPDDGQIRRKK